MTSRKYQAALTAVATAEKPTLLPDHPIGLPGRKKTIRTVDVDLWQIEEGTPIKEIPLVSDKETASAITATLSRLAELIPNISDGTYQSIFNDIRNHPDRGVYKEWQAQPTSG